MRRIACCGLLLLVASCLAVPAWAAIGLPAVFSENMVLQQGIHAPVWGTASPGAEVTVSIAGRSYGTIAGADGRWLLRLSPLSAGGPHELKIAGDGSEIVIKNVAVGEVWVASGQSNMAWPLKWAANAEREMAACNYPMIRFFELQNETALTPRADCEGHWSVSTPQECVNFSAVAYFFARKLHHDLGVPVGILQTAWGGTIAEAWMPREALAADPELAYLNDNRDVALADFADKYYEWATGPLRAWLAAAEQARAAGKRLPPVPRDELPQDPQYNPNFAAQLYNGMIAPLVPYGIAGAIWYQGESNAGRAHQYRRLFPALITSWRQAWGQGDFPFLFVQLANFMDAKPEPGDSAWAELREAQAMTLSLPATGMAVTIDIGDAKDIHPRNKQDVGARLALWAEANWYGKRQEFSGPLYDRMSIEGNRIRLFFKHAGTELVAKGQELKGFAIAGEDRKFVWAQAHIERNTVVVSSPRVPRPVAVRYAWADNPVCNLYNSAGLPASPFRTDDWPGLTVGQK